MNIQMLRPIAINAIKERTNPTIYRCIWHFSQIIFYIYLQIANSCNFYVRLPYYLLFFKYREAVLSIISYFTAH